MLYEVKTLFDNGTEIDELIYSKTAYSILPKKSKIKKCIVNSFKYEYKHLSYPPALMISVLDGKKYIVPTWQEVHPQTELSDIEWVKPVLKKEKKVFEIIGSTGDKYKTIFNPNNKKWNCTCPGFWRAKDKQCKHIKEKINLIK
jgi:hypothetical protein